MRLISCFSPCGRKYAKDFADDGPQGPQEATPPPVMESCTSEALTNTGPVRILSVDMQPWRVASPKDQSLLSQLSPGCLTPLTWLGEGAYGCVELCRVSIPVRSQSNNLLEDGSLHETRCSRASADGGEQPSPAAASRRHASPTGADDCIGGGTDPEGPLSPSETVVVRQGRFSIQRLRLSPRETPAPSPSPTPPGGTRPSTALSSLSRPHRKPGAPASEVTTVSPTVTPATAQEIRFYAPSPASAPCGGTPPPLFDVRQFGPSTTLSRLRGSWDGPLVPPESPRGASSSAFSNELVVAVKRVEYRGNRGGGGGAARGADGGTGTAGAAAAGDGNGGGGGSRPRGGGGGGCKGPSRTRLNRMQAIELLQLARCRECPFIVRVFGCVPDEPPPRSAAGSQSSPPRGAAAASPAAAAKPWHSSACRIVMEWAEGGDLGSLLKTLAARRTPCADITRERLLMSEASARYYLACLLEALSFLHSKNLLHRDVKPANLLLTSDGRAKLGDLGMVCHLDKDGCAVGRAGTPNYMAPEVWACSSSSKHLSYGANADLWSAGVVLYELLTGHLPATHPDDYHRPTWRLNTRHPSFSPELRDLLSRLVCPRPRRRLQSCAEVVAHPWFAGFDWEALRDGTLPAPYVPAAHRPKAAGTLGSSVGAGVGAGLVVAVGGLGGAATEINVNHEMPPVLEERASSGEAGNGPGDADVGGNEIEDGVGSRADDGAAAFGLRSSRRVAASAESLHSAAAVPPLPLPLRRSTSALPARSPCPRYRPLTGQGQSCPTSPAGRRPAGAASGACASASAIAGGSGRFSATAALSGAQPRPQDAATSAAATTASAITTDERRMVRPTSMPVQRCSLPDPAQPSVTPLSSVTSVDVAMPRAGGCADTASATIGGGASERLSLIGSVLAAALGASSRLSRLGAQCTASTRLASGASSIVRQYGGESQALSRVSSSSLGSNLLGPGVPRLVTSPRGSATANTHHNTSTHNTHTHIISRCLDSAPDCTASGAVSTNPSAYGMDGTTAERDLSSRTHALQSPACSAMGGAEADAGAADLGACCPSSPHRRPSVVLRLSQPALSRSPSRSSHSYLAAASCFVGCLAPAAAPPVSLDLDSAATSCCTTPAARATGASEAPEALSVGSAAAGASSSAAAGGDGGSCAAALAAQAAAPPPATSAQLSSFLTAMSTLQHQVQGLGPASRRAGDWMQQRLAAAATAAGAVPGGILAAVVALASGGRRGSAGAAPASLMSPALMEGLPCPVAPASDGVQVQDPEDHCMPAAGPHGMPALATGADGTQSLRAAGSGLAGCSDALAPAGHDGHHRAGHVEAEGAALGASLTLLPGPHIDSYAAAAAAAATQPTPSSSDSGGASGVSPPLPQRLVAQAAAETAAPLVAMVSLIDMAQPQQQQPRHAEPAEVVVVVRRTCTSGVPADSADDGLRAGGVDGSGGGYTTTSGDGAGTSGSRSCSCLLFPDTNGVDFVERLPSLATTQSPGARTAEGEGEDLATSEGPKGASPGSAEPSAWDPAVIMTTSLTPQSASARAGLDGASVSRRTPSFSFDIDGILFPAGTCIGDGSPIPLSGGGGGSPLLTAACPTLAAAGTRGRPDSVASGSPGLTPRMVWPSAEELPASPQGSQHDWPHYRGPHQQQQQQQQQMLTPDAWAAVSPSSRSPGAMRRRPLLGGEMLPGCGWTGALLGSEGGAHGTAGVDSSSRAMLYSASAALMVLVCAVAWARVLMEVASRSRVW